MADIESQIVNFYESTLATLLASAATSATVASAPTTNGTTVINASSGSPIYLVIDPDNSGNREVVSVTTSLGTTLSGITRDLENRYGGTPPDHQVGTTIRLAVLAEHFEDMNDRLDTGLASLATAISTSDLQDDDTFASPGADKVASSESIKAYADTKLPLAGGTMTGAINASDQEISAAVLKDYAETDVALSSSSGVVAIDLANGNTGSLTLTENVTGFEFTNVPTNGVSSFTVKVTQDASTAYTVAIDDIDINAPTLTAQTAKTAGAAGFTMTATLSAEDLLFFLFFDAGTPYLTATQEMS